MPGLPSQSSSRESRYSGASRRVSTSHVSACRIAAWRAALKGRVRSRALALSGHSLRAGYITAAAPFGIPEWKIRRRSRHQTAEMVAGYVRAAEEWTDSGLKGVGF
jgi:hypothetical protein